MYREDFQNILRKLHEIWWYFSRVDKTSLQQCASNSRNRLNCKPVLQKGTSSRCVLLIRKLSKYDHVIYGAVKVKTSRKTD